MKTDKRKITINEVERLEYEDQLIVGNFLIERCSEPMNFLGQIVTMYSTEKFQIVDMFNCIAWDGDAESVTNFMNGLNGFVDEEEFLNSYSKATQ